MMVAEGSHAEHKMGRSSGDVSGFLVPLTAMMAGEARTIRCWRFVAPGIDPQVVPTRGVLPLRFGYEVATTRGLRRRRHRPWRERAVVPAPSPVVAVNPQAVGVGAVPAHQPHRQARATRLW